MRSFTLFFTAVAALLYAGSSFAADAASPLGKWRTFDPETGKANSIVEISDSNGTLSGKVLEVLYSKKGPNPNCDDCSGERKNQPVTGMVIVWDMKKDGDAWSGGRVVNPTDGNEYDCRFKLIENGNKLELRAFKGVSLLGKTRIWERVTP